MDDVVDLLDRPIDERARRAGAELHRAASLRSLPDPPSTRSTVGRTVVLAMAIAGALVAGLIVIGNRQNDAEPAGPNDDLHWVIDGLPQGWAPVDVRGPGNAVPTDPNGPIFSIFGTDAAPAGPVLQTAVTPDFGVQPVAPFATNYAEHTVDGVDVVLASSSADTRLAWVKLADNWLPLRAKGMSDDQLLDVAAHLSVAGDGSVTLASGHVPDGLKRLSTGSIAQVAPASWSGLGMQGELPGTLTVDYRQGAAGGAMISLTISRSVAGQLVYDALSTSDTSAVQIDGIQVWQTMNDRGAPAYAAWQRDGQLFILATSEPGSVDLPTLAATVRPASQDEWGRMSTTASTGLDRTTSTDQPSGTVLEGIDAPSSTDPPAVVPDEIRDIALQFTITGQRPHEATLAVTLPDGVQSKISVVVVGDSISMGSDELGWMTYPWDGGAATRLELQGIGALVVTHDPRATQLRVQRANGDRYTLDLVTLAGEPDTHFAVVTLPAGQFVSSELLDAEGNVLDHFDHF